MYLLGRPRYIDFRLLDSSNNPITGVALAGLTVSLRRNNAAVSETFSLMEQGQGEYTLSYTPSAAGHDYVEIYHASSDTRIVDSEDIFSAASFGAAETMTKINHSTDTSLVVTNAPDGSRVYVYLSSDWDAGTRDPSSALGSSGVTGNGSWLNPVFVTSGTYHVVVIGYGYSHVLKSYLTV